MIFSHRTLILFAGALFVGAGCTPAPVPPPDVPTPAPSVNAVDPVFETEDDKSDLIRVDAPEHNALVTDPFMITGEARGTWFFEASFPIFLEDGNGNELGIAIATAQDEWMTENFVPFEAEMTFDPPTSPTGTLILKKDNPSGLPEHDDELRILVRFPPETVVAPE